MNAIGTPLPRPASGARRAWSKSYTPETAGHLRRIRRYAVPRWMIEQATEHRLAGDWRGACAAADVDVPFDLADVAHDHGDAVAAELEDDLLHLAPDLLRWHLPRGPAERTTIRPGLRVVLRGYGRRAGAHPYLHVVTPGTVDGPQRLVLRFGRVKERDGQHAAQHVQDWTFARHLWDARRAGELLERCGGGDRAPFFAADGTPRALPAAPPGPVDPVALTEWAALLHERGEVEAAFAAAGIELDATPPRMNRSSHRMEPLAVLERLPLALTRLGPEVRRLQGEGLGSRYQVPPPYPWGSAVLLELDRGGLRARLVDAGHTGDIPALAEACWRRLPDLDLLRRGDVGPDHLHPLVRAALFPRRATTGGPIGPPGPDVPPAPVRVRCRGEWHVVAFRDGALRVPHDEDEQRRERALGALGGAVTGCFTVLPVVRSGTGRLPKALRAQRREVFARADHGDAPGVLRFLDAGMDPHIRSGGRRTLLHTLHLLDHEELLPRLLAAGLDVDARDHYGSTPLLTAVGHGGSARLVRALLAAGARIEAVNQDESTPLLVAVGRSAPVEVVRALLDAGARTDVTDRWGSSVRDHIHRCKRGDLAFLKKELDRDHPGLGHGRWPWPHRQEEEE
ncbi:ankyrin repeat domain-containing protein [Actinoallomurus purpureus]|uniref:ankyrin repeat domain-containing protein n=1 Tax=Actinoallomurus purpureus TaxID=478114 RepID=UPI0020925F5F|nr:ankyrin repeat domain-containing protein [Actinoallomurus purpureus]MCO6010413.1 ankyrin repeat domain-containing protein [Actinoallomurus purpureus]